MSSSEVDGPVLRADARRNRDRLLSVARTAFTTDGDAASLDGIAKQAGVGIGTLYRHFPTREALVEAVFRHELAEVCAAVDDLLVGRVGAVALRAWTDRYAAFVATKRGMAESLRAVLTSGNLETARTRERVTEAIATILAVGEADGTLRGDVRAGDVAAALVGIFLATSAAADPEQAGRMLDLLVDGLRPRTDRQGPPAAR